MSEGTDGQEPQSLRHQASAGGAADSSINSSLPSIPGDGSPADTHQAVHSASASCSHIGGAVEQGIGTDLTNTLSEHRQYHWEENWRQENPLIGAPNLVAMEDTTENLDLTSKGLDLPSFATSNTHGLRVDDDDDEDDDDDDEVPSQPQLENFQLSPTFSDGLPQTRSVSHDEAPSSPRSARESSEDINYGQEAARHLSEEQTQVGLGAGKVGGTALHKFFLWPEINYKRVTEEQLHNEALATYSGLDMCEKATMKYDKEFSTEDVTDDEDLMKKFRVFTNVHLQLLQEHQDLLSLCSNSEAGPKVKSMPDTYMLTIRLWRHGIHDYLEIMRHHLPESLDYMLLFIHHSYSMLANLLAQAPAYEETWMECLGDLSRYRMAVETTDALERELWAGIAMAWYSRAADRNPDVGKFHHHLGVIARHDINQKLFYYTKSLLVEQPFQGTVTSILDIFSPFLKDSEAMHRIPPVGAYIAAHAFLFIGDFGNKLCRSVNTFLSHFNKYVTHLSQTFTMQGFFISACNIAAILGYGNQDSLLAPEFDASNELGPLNPRETPPSVASLLTPPEDLEKIKTDFLASRDSPDLTPTLFYGSYMTYKTISMLLDRIGDRHIYAACHVYLAFLWCLALTPNGMKHMEAVVPWRKIAIFLNSLFRSYIKPDIAEKSEFPVSEETTWVAEDFLIRGQCWSQRLYPPSFFDGAPSPDDGRHVELPSRDITRMYRCIWLGVRLSMFKRWITYDFDTRTFSTTSFVSDLERLAEQYDPFATQTS